MCSDTRMILAHTGLTTMNRKIWLLEELNLFLQILQESSPHHRHTCSLAIAVTSRHSPELISCHSSAIKHKSTRCYTQIQMHPTGRHLVKKQIKIYSVLHHFNQDFLRVTHVFIFIDIIFNII